MGCETFLASRVDAAKLQSTPKRDAKMQRVEIRFVLVTGLVCHKANMITGIRDKMGVGCIGVGYQTFLMSRVSASKLQLVVLSRKQAEFRLLDRETQTLHSRLESAYFYMLF